MKKVCNGYVTEQEFSKAKALIFNKYLCNGYVTEPANYPPSFTTILFDCKIIRTTKITVKPLLSNGYLFDGCLTENKKEEEETKNKAHAKLVQSPNAQGGLGKFYQLFGEQTEEIINELNEALAA